MVATIKRKVSPITVLYQCFDCSVIVITITQLPIQKPNTKSENGIKYHIIHSCDSFLILSVILFITIHMYVKRRKPVTLLFTPTMTK